MQTAPINVYAQRQNDKFKTVEDEYVTIEERFKNLIKARPELEELFIELVEEFKDRYEFESYEDMMKFMVNQGRIGYIPASQEDINVTMQREPDGDWLVELLGSFRPIRINSVRTYQDPYRKDGKVSRYIAWDGQHTSLILFIIAYYGFGLEADKIMIPVDVYPGHNRKEIRELFLYFNSGAGSKTLDAIDMFTQHVYSYNNDGARDFWAERCYDVQQMAEKYGMFFTAEKFGDDTLPGAVVRMSEVMNKNYPQSVFDRLFYYHANACADKPAYSLEVLNLCDYFRDCLTQNIVVTNDYIDEMIRVLEPVTGNTWANGSRKHQMVIKAYHNWHAKAKADGTIPKDSKAPRCNQENSGPNWIAQALVANGFTQLVPMCSKENIIYADADLRA